MYVNKLPDLATLNERFEIDPSCRSGLRWKINPSGPWACKGDPTGGLNSGGYYQTKVNGTLYYNHRLVWKMTTGNDPVNVIDHIDGDTSNNAFSNLQDITQAQNLRKKAGEVIAA